MILFDFNCLACNAVFEEFVKPNVTEIPCIRCSEGTAHRMISVPRLDPRMGLDSGFPTAWDKWERTRRSHHTKGSKSEDL